MSEVALWDAYRPHLEQMGLDPVRVENSLGEGTPDVNYVHGWIELKDVAGGWPRRGGPVDFGYRPGQVPWLMRRWSRGGLCWTLARGGGDVLLFDGGSSRDLNRGLVLHEVVARAAWRKPPGNLTPDMLASLKGWLTGEVLTASDRAKLCRLRAMFTEARVADDMGWTLDRLRLAEVSQGPDAEDLISYWEA